MGLPLYIQTQVLEGNKIQIQDPSLKVGETVDIIIQIPEKSQPKKQKISDIVKKIDEIRQHRSCFRTPEEVDQYLREERDSWD
jgi:hypothetical protein